MHKAKEQSKLLLAPSTTIRQRIQFLNHSVLKLGITYAYAYYPGGALQYPEWNHVNEQKRY